MGLVVGYMAWSEGSWAGLAIDSWIMLVMLILGIILGLTSITAKEVTPFLIATIALVVAASANVWSPLGNIHQLLYFLATGILRYIVAFAAPAAVIIAIKAVFTMVKEK
jgi:hypothetical protein